MRFKTEISKKPYTCEVTHYSPGHQGRFTGPLHLRHEGEPGEFEFVILDQDGNRAEQVENELCSIDKERLLREFLHGTGENGL